MYNEEKKYTAKIHLNPDSAQVIFAGTVSADTIKDVKEAARDQARRLNHHRRRIHIEITGPAMRDPQEMYLRT